MTKRASATSIRVAAFFAGLVVLSACSTNSNSFPQIANPPAFDYADGEELRSRMHQLAFELQQLDVGLATEYDERPDFQREVVRTLDNIERIATFLQEGDLSTRHPFLLDDMQRFVDDVRHASRDAQRNNPRYYMAGRISGSCMNCHRNNE